MLSRRRSSRPPETIEAQRHRQNTALAIGACFIALGAVGVGGWVTDRTAGWSAPSLGVGAVLILIGLYAAVGVTLLGLPFPSPRAEPVWRGAWSALPWSTNARERRKEARRQALKERVLNLLAGEAMRSGLNAYRAAQSLYEAVVDPHPRNYWVALSSGGRYMLGFNASGNIAEVEGPDLDNPEVQSHIELFEAIVAQAQDWPETKELNRLGR